MELEKITTSLEVSKKLSVALKKANIKVEPLFYWVRSNSMGSERIYILESDRCSNFDEGNSWKALTASEIGAILSKANYWGELKLAYVNVMDLTEDLIIPEQMMLNIIEQPDIGALMLCYLIDNNLIK